MKREILFRGKRLDDGKWLEGYYSEFKQLPNSCIYYVYKNHTLVNDVDPSTICQYIGLTDKNGRKIFEGDIVQYTDEVIGKEKIDEVEYNETHAAFCRLHKSKMGLQYLFIDESITNKCEVIGNIFDNPELIEKQRLINEYNENGEFPHGTVGILVQAADTIESLSAKLSVANMERSQRYYNSKWIPCKERIPFTRNNLLVCQKDGYVSVGYYSQGQFLDLNSNPFENVIAWCELPEPYHEP